MARVAAHFVGRGMAAPVTEEDLVRLRHTMVQRERERLLDNLSYASLSIGRCLSQRVCAHAQVVAVVGLLHACGGHCMQTAGM
jgi:hypothetical protein